MSRYITLELIPRCMDVSYTNKQTPEITIEVEKNDVLDAFSTEDLLSQFTVADIVDYYGEDVIADYIGKILTERMITTAFKK